MKNLFQLLAMLLVFVLAMATDVSDRETREVSERVRRSDDLWNFFRKDKDKKKKKKKKNKKTTAKPTTIATSTSPPIPTTKPKGKLPDKVLKELLKLNTTQQLEKYLGLTKSMSMAMRAKTSKEPSPPSLKVVGQNAAPGEIECGCKPSLKRIFLDNPYSHLGMYYPSNCVATYLCSGGCLIPDYQECQPVNKKVISFDKPFVYFDGGFAIKSHDIEYHSSCACKCKKKACHDRMEFREDYCECRCKAEYSRAKLQCKAPYEYYEDSCSCKCPFKFRVCPSGQVWHTNSCSCKCPVGRVMIGSKCSAIAMSNGK